MARDDDYKEILKLLKEASVANAEILAEMKTFATREWVNDQLKPVNETLQTYKTEKGTYVRDGTIFNKYLKGLRDDINKLKESGVGLSMIWRVVIAIGVLVSLIGGLVGIVKGLS